METLKKATHVNGKDHAHKRSTVGLAATNLLKHPKKRTSSLYKKAKAKIATSRTKIAASRSRVAATRTRVATNVANRVTKAEHSVKVYRENLVKRVQKNPLASILVASGIGYLFASLFRR